MSSKQVNFYNRVKMLRVERGLSRQQLAELINVHPQTIGYIERQQFNPTIELALNLSKALGVAEPFELVDEAALRTSVKTNK